MTIAQSSLVEIADIQHLCTMKKTIYFLVLITCIGIGLGCKADPSPAQNNSTAPVGTGDALIDRLSEDIARDDDNADLYFQRSQAFYEREAYDRAIADMEKAMTIDSLQPQYYHHLSDVFMDYYKSRKALYTMRVAKMLFPDRVPTLLKLAETQYILQQHEQSMSTLNDIFYINKQDAETFFMLGLNLKATDQMEKAKEAFKQAVDRDPELIDAWLSLGNIAEQENDPIASTYYDNAVRIQPDNLAAMHSKAFYLQNNGQIPAAIQLYRDIVAKDRDYRDAYLNMGVLYMEQDSVDLAYEQFNIIVKTHPADPIGYYYRGITNEVKKDYINARADYKTAIALKGGYPEAEEAFRAIKDK